MTRLPSESCCSADLNSASASHAAFSSDSNCALNCAFAPPSCRSLASSMPFVFAKSSSDLKAATAFSRASFRFAMSCSLQFGHAQLGGSKPHAHDSRVVGYFRRWVFDEGAEAGE